MITKKMIPGQSFFCKNGQIIMMIVEKIQSILNEF
jgi:hypothetical protein